MDRTTLDLWVGIFVVGGIAALVFWKHRENIKRLMKGEEPKISVWKNGKSAPT